MKYVLIVLLTMTISAVNGQSFTATINADTVDVMPGDGLCADNNGQCSFRAAIMESNANTNHNVINLFRGVTYKITRPNVSNFDSDGDFDINENVTIQIINPHIPIQSVAELPTIDADGLDRVFEINGAEYVTIDGLRIINGDATTAGYIGGGAIIAEDNVVELTIKNSVLENNQGTHGGALHLLAETVVIEKTDISLNFTSTGGGGVIGAAIFQGLGDLYIYRSSIHHNGRVDSKPGCVYAIQNYYDATSTTIMNSTIAHNGDVNDGRCVGGFSAINGDVILNNNTIVANQNRGIHYYDDLSDGAVYQFKMRNTILDNYAANCSFPEGNIDTGNVSAGNNISSDPHCGLFEAAGNGNVNNTALNLHPGRGLYGAGSYFWHHEPLPYSLAVDNGSTLALMEQDEDACSPTDQISGQRNIDGDFDGMFVCDSGAIEFNRDLIFYSGME